MAKKRKDGKDQTPWRNTSPCPFCKRNTSPDWKDAELLRKFLRQDGGIHSWKKTKCCDRHQRQLAKAVANAREMALLPYKAPRYRT